MHIKNIEAPFACTFWIIQPEFMSRRMCIRELKDVDVLAVKLIAISVPVTNWMARNVPISDPKFQNAEIFEGIGMLSELVCLVIFYS